MYERPSATGETATIHLVWLRGRSDLAARADQHDAEGLLALDAATDQEPVARLEDVKRQECAGKEDRAQREERKQFAHRLNGTLARVPGNVSMKQPRLP